MSQGVAALGEKGSKTQLMGEKNQTYRKTAFSNKNRTSLNAVDAKTNARKRKKAAEAWHKKKRPSGTSKHMKFREKQNELCLCFNKEENNDGAMGNLT